MIKPYWESQDGRYVVYCGDCREIFAEIKGISAVITDPPYPNGEGYFDDAIIIAKEVLNIKNTNESLIFWSEIEYPPISNPLVAVHIWHRTNVNGKIYEPIYHLNSDGKKRRSCIKRHAAIFYGVGPGCNEYEGHPTQKPIAIMEWLIDFLDNKNLIVDPFMGIGSTGVACLRKKIPFIGIEISEEYCKIAVDRIKRELAQPRFEFEEHPNLEQADLF